MKFLKAVKTKTTKIIKKNWFEIILFTVFFIFSWWLMWHTFKYENGIIKIALKAWSDFAGHLPLIRSFSWGKNFPPEYPIFPGEPIRYHFLFYAFVGLLERISLPLDWALNLPSAFSFGLLLVAIFYFSFFLFKSKFVSFLSVLFFLFNSSFSFFYFLREQTPLSFKTLTALFQNQKFPAFAPYDQSLISGGFWNLNVFTNQRHFAFPLAIILFGLLFLLKKIKKNHLGFKEALFLGLIVGLFPFLHGAGFIMFLAVLTGIFLLFGFKKEVSLTLITAGLIALPQILYLRTGQGGFGLRFKPGYLVANNLTWFTFGRYWFLNLGLSSLLIPLGFFLSSRFAKKIFLVFLPIFFLGNLFQFGPDIAVNHKFFNLWLIIANMFSAYLLFYLWQKKSWLNKVLVFFAVFLLTLSGVVDLFAIKNDPPYLVLDAPLNPEILWIKNNTPPDAIFLNSSYLYHPANLAGRKIFLGWPYFSWSAGYDTYQRGELMKKMFKPNSLRDLCRDLKANNISFLAIERKREPDFQIDYEFFEKNFKKIYSNPKAKLTIFTVSPSCQTIYFPQDNLVN